MAGRERKDAHGRQDGVDWFIDFEQDDLGAGTVIPQARRRPGQPGPAEPKPDSVPRPKGPSPWVADFLLNQVEGARIEPTVRRKRTSAEGKRGTERNTSARRAGAGDKTVMADELAATPAHVADGRAATPGPIPRAEPPLPPPVTGGAKTGEYSTRPYALAGALMLGLAAGLWTLPQGDRRDAAPDGTDAHSARTATVAKNPDGPPEPRDAWRALPLQAIAILQPPRVISVQAAPTPSSAVHGEPIALASLADAPSVTLSAPAPASTAATLPVPTTQVVHPPGPNVTPIRGAVEVTARDVDERRAVASGPPSAEDPAPGAHPVSGTDQAPPASEAVSTARKVITVTEGEPQGDRPRHHLRAARRSDMRRQATRPASSRVAQAAQPRSFALPAALRPTSF